MGAKRSQERVAVRVARELVSDIRRRRLGPGTQLDPEHRMVEKFGVARGTVREALRFLELQGALRIKAGPGGGPVVSVPGADHLASVLSLHLQFADASFRSVVDARKAIYPALAAEAAENASGQDLENLRAGIVVLKAATDDASEFRAEARRLMAIIATASGNRVLALLVDSLHRMSEDSGAWPETQRRLALRSYTRVVDAIEQRDADRARALMEGMLAEALEHWERVAADELKQPVRWIASER